MTPPIKLAVQKPNGIDAINFRKMQESISLDLEVDGLKMISTVEKTNPFEKFDSCKCKIYLIFDDVLILNIVTLYHDGDSDTETD